MQQNKARGELSIPGKLLPGKPVFTLLLEYIMSIVVKHLPNICLWDQSVTKFGGF